jgi:hypothetical protein
LQRRVREPSDFAGPHAINCEAVPRNIRGLVTERSVSAIYDGHQIGAESPAETFVKQFVRGSNNFSDWRNKPSRFAIQSAEATSRFDAWRMTMSNKIKLALAFAIAVLSVLPASVETSFACTNYFTYSDTAAKPDACWSQ